MEEIFYVDHSEPSNSVKCENTVKFLKVTICIIAIHHRSENQLKQTLTRHSQSILSVKIL